MCRSQLFLFLVKHGRIWRNANPLGWRPLRGSNCSITNAAGQRRGRRHRFGSIPRSCSYQYAACLPASSRTMKFFAVMAVMAVALPVYEVAARAPVDVSMEAVRRNPESILEHVVEDMSKKLDGHPEVAEKLKEAVTNDGIIDDQEEADVTAVAKSVEGIDEDIAIIQAIEKENPGAVLKFMEKKITQDPVLSAVVEEARKADISDEQVAAYVSRLGDIVADLKAMPKAQLLAIISSAQKVMQSTNLFQLLAGLMKDRTTQPVLESAAMALLQRKDELKQMTVSAAINALIEQTPSNMQAQLRGIMDAAIRLIEGVSGVVRSAPVELQAKLDDLKKMTNIEMIQAQWAFRKMHLFPMILGQAKGTAYEAAAKQIVKQLSDDKMIQGLMEKQLEAVRSRKQPLESDAHVRGRVRKAARVN